MDTLAALALTLMAFSVTGLVVIAGLNQWAEYRARQTKWQFRDAPPPLRRDPYQGSDFCQMPRTFSNVVPLHPARGIHHWPGGDAA